MRMSQMKALSLMSEEKDIIILDVRSHDEYASGHIKGAINFPNEAISNVRPGILTDLSQTILVYCYTGMRAGSAVRKLKRLGYKNVHNIGGIKSWPGEIVK